MIYLNNAALGWPSAPGVSRSILRVMGAPPHFWGRSGARKGDPVEECRKTLADLLEVTDPSRIVLTHDATLALNTAILGLGIENDCRIVTTVAEHNSVLRPIHLLRQRYPGIEVTRIGLTPDGGLDVMQAADAMRRHPRLVALTHASNVTGRLMDVAPIFEMAKRVGAITLLDAAQTLGCIPLLPEAMHADLVAFTGHKWLHGPPGTAGLYVHPDVELNPIWVGGTGYRGDLPGQPREMPMRLEAGSLSAPAFAGLVTALRHHREMGEEFMKRAIDLSQRLRSELGNIPGVTLADPSLRGHRVPIVSLCMASLSPESLEGYLFKQYGILGRAGLHCAPLMHQSLGTFPNGAFRLSPSGFNTPSEIDTVIRAFHELSQNPASEESAGGGTLPARFPPEAEGK